MEKQTTAAGNGHFKGEHMAKGKVYAVKKGKTTGLFYSWTECSAAVSGYPGAEYKGFPTEGEARAWLGGGCLEEEKRKDSVSSLTVYVDGSFDESLGKYSFGCIILTPEGGIEERFGNGSQPESLAIRNVAGEMLGAMYAVQWAINKGYKELVLRYDYEGIEKWAAGAWKAKNTLTQKYADFMRSRQRFIRISFEKVKAHSGDYYNERADELAKRALTEGSGIPEIR